MGERAADLAGEAIRVTHCPQCRYSLAGLPMAGRCPECGAGYDPSREVVVFGWGSGVKERRHNAVNTGSMRWWFGGFPAVWVGMVLYEFVKVRGPVDWGKIVGVAILYVLSCGWALYRRSRLRHLPAPVVARASWDGFGQRNGVGRVVLNPWDGGDVVKLEAVGEGRYRLWVWRRRPTVIGRGDSVDIVIEADRDRAEGLRSRIESFQRQAAGQGE